MKTGYELGLRPMLRGHLNRILEIQKSVFGESYREDMLKLHGKKNVMSYVVTRGPVIVGYTFWKYANGTVDVIELAVDPLHQREGVGRLSIAELRKIVARKNRYNQIRAFVPADDFDTLKFFAAVGFDAFAESDECVRMTWSQRGVAVRNRIEQYF